jgi:hypothetical protein
MAIAIEVVAAQVTRIYAEAGDALRKSSYLSGSVFAVFAVQAHPFRIDRFVI